MKLTVEQLPDAGLNDAIYDGGAVYIRGNGRAWYVINKAGVIRLSEYLPDDMPAGKHLAPGTRIILTV